MSREAILARLRRNPDIFISGEVISRELGISRAAVSKAVSALRKDGYEIAAVTNRGYRLLSGPNRLSEGEVLPWVRTKQVGTQVLCFPVVDSTNSYLKREALSLPHGTVVLANEQTGGRGRLGRSFQSPPDRGVYLSTLLRPELPPERALNLTAFVAVAVCEAIERVTGLTPQIKWTNDIVLGGKKVCGILTEMSIEGESGALQHIITGIGVNVNQRAEEFPEELRHIAGSLYMVSGKEVPRGRLAAELINALDQMYAAWCSGGADYLERYRSRCLTVGRQVRLIRGGGQVEEATALAVDESFALVVEHPDGRRESVTSGEVSVRGLWGYT